MKAYKAGWILGIAVLAMLISAWSGSDFAPGLAFPENAAERAAEVLTALAAVALFLERALSIIVDLMFPAEPGERATIITGAGEDRNRALGTLLRRQADKQRVRIIAGFALSSALALAGVRILKNLFEALPTGGQLTLFVALDVLLTAGLLAGGSAVIATMIDWLKNRGLLSLVRAHDEARVAELRRPRSDEGPRNP